MENPPDRHPPGEPGAALDEGDSAFGEVSVRRIQILNLGLLGLAALASAWISGAFALGVVAGGALMAANFGIIVSVIRAVFLKGQAGVLKVGLYWVKFAVVMLIAAVLILFFRVDGIGLLVGLSTILVAILIEALLRMAQSS